MAGEVGAPVDAEFGVDVGQVGLHGAGGDVQPARDGEVGLALGGQRGDLPFPGRQRDRAERAGQPG